MEPKPVRDDAGAQATIRQTQDRRVPDDLVHQLHEADGRADELRKRLEAAMASADVDHAGRTEQVGEALRQAEREIERITVQIRDAAPPQAKGG